MKCEIWGKKEGLLTAKAVCTITSNFVISIDMWNVDAPFLTDILKVITRNIPAYEALYRIFLAAILCNRACNGKKLAMAKFKGPTLSGAEPPLAATLSFNPQANIGPKFCSLPPNELNANCFSL